MTLACLSLAPGLTLTLEELSSFLGTFACLAAADFCIVGSGFLVSVFPPGRLVTFGSMVFVWHPDPLSFPTGITAFKSINPQIQGNQSASGFGDSGG
jgi:hypothetical protein